MKNILILAFGYESDVSKYHFELLHKHYNKLITHFCLPIKHYGVFITEQDTFIDESKGIIYIHKKSEDYDKNLILKVLDTLKYVEGKIDFDWIIKTNTSFVMNLININQVLQRETKNIVHCSTLYVNNKCNYVYTTNVYPRGNCICLTRKNVEYLNNFENVEDAILTNWANNDYKDVSLGDDYIIGGILSSGGDYIIVSHGQLEAAAPMYYKDIIVQDLDDFYGCWGISTKYPFDYRKDIPQDEVITYISTTVINCICNKIEKDYKIGYVPKYLKD